MIEVVDMSGVVHDVALFLIFITAVWDKHHILTFLARNLFDLHARYLTELLLEYFVSEPSLSKSSSIITLIVIAWDLFALDLQILICKFAFGS